MKLSESIKINKPLEIVWKTITDFNNCVDFIESIKEIEILNEPNCRVPIICGSVDPNYQKNFRKRNSKYRRNQWSEWRQLEAVSEF